MIVWAPDGRFGAHRELNELVHQMDIGPTLMDLAGIKKPDPMSAQSLMPMLDPAGDSATCARDVVFAEQAKDGNFTTSRFMTMVRTRDWKLVHFLDESWGQLFDLNADPLEVNNLWNRKDHATKQNELLAVLREWRIRDAYENAAVWAEYR
jgi:arylsulfatase